MAARGGFRRDNRGTAPPEPDLDHGSPRVTKRKAASRFGALSARPRMAVALAGGALLFSLNSLKLGMAHAPGSLSRVPERFADDVADALGVIERYRDAQLRRRDPASTGGELSCARRPDGELAPRAPSRAPPRRGRRLALVVPFGKDSIERVATVLEHWRQYPPCDGSRRAPPPASSGTSGARARARRNRATPVSSPPHLARPRIPLRAQSP